MALLLPSLAGASLPEMARLEASDAVTIDGTEVLPERGAEAASWIQEENDLSDQNHLHETRWWIAPLIGINDQLELAIPAEVASQAKLMWLNYPNNPTAAVATREFFAKAVALAQKYGLTGVWVAGSLAGGLLCLLGGDDPRLRDGSTLDRSFHPAILRDS